VISNAAKQRKRKRLIKKILVWLILLALAGAAVCIAGLIGFLGLIVPHVIRKLIGSEDHRRLALLTMLGGSCLTLLCDMAARLLFAPYEVPVGILLSVLGVPFFLWLLYKQGRRRRT